MMKNIRGETPLDLASQFGHIDTVRSLFLSFIPFLPSLPLLLLLFHLSIIVTVYGCNGMIGLSSFGYLFVQVTSLISLEHPLTNIYICI